jgi:hypothetical protein
MAHIIQYPDNDGFVAVFDTEAEAAASQEHCYQNHMGNHNDNEDYTAQTTDWAIPRERTDGKWTVPVCHHTDATGATNIELASEQEYVEA